MLRRTLIAGLAIAALALPAAAQTWPQRPVSVIVPFAAGGPTDAVARLVSEAMGKELGQSLIVENVGGAGGTLGAARVASARPDGYTLLLHHIGMATIPTLYRRLPYDPMAFETIGLITAAPMTVVVRKDHPAKTFQELVAWIREKKDDANLGNAGLGAASQLCGTLLQYLLQTPMTTVPFRGTGPAMTELLAGRIDVMCDQTTNTVEHIKAGGIRVLAVTTPERLAVLPDVPTTTELGMADLQVAIWHGFYAPKGTPAAIIERASAALRAALRDEKVISRFAELGLAPEPQDRAMPAPHRAFWQAEVAKWRPVLQSAGQYAD
jgi:tripartite-type tricarboxylate transporter receptor subunit TctC